MVRTSLFCGIAGWYSLNAYAEHELGEIESLPHQKEKFYDWIGLPLQRKHFYFYKSIFFLHLVKFLSTFLFQLGHDDIHLPVNFLRNYRASVGRQYGAKI